MLQIQKLKTAQRAMIHAGIVVVAADPTHRRQTAAYSLDQLLAGLTLCKIRRRETKALPASKLFGGLLLTDLLPWHPQPCTCPVIESSHRVMPVQGKAYTMQSFCRDCAPLAFPFQAC